MCCQKIYGRNYEVLHPGNNSTVINNKLTIEVGHSLKGNVYQYSNCVRPDFYVNVNNNKYKVDWTKNGYGNYFTEVSIDTSTTVQKILLESVKCKNIKIIVNYFEDKYFASEKIVEDFFLKQSADELSNNWIDSILLVGIIRYVKEKEGSKIDVINKIKKFYEMDQSRELTLSSPDEVSIGLSAIEFYKLSNYYPQKRISESLRFFSNEPVNPIGALNHIGYHHRFRSFLPKTRKILKFFGGIFGDYESIWVDSLIMYGLTALHISTMNQDSELFKFAVNQPLIFSKYLQEKNGLFRHSYNWKTDRKKPIDDTYWLRGNGWALWSLIETIELLPSNDPNRELLVEIYLKAVNAIIAYRDPTHHLWDTTIINSDGAGYLESSGSALVAYAIGRGVLLELLPQDYSRYSQEAFYSLTEKVIIEDEEVKFVGASGPTNAMRKRTGYLSIIVNKSKTNVGYGLGSYLLLASILVQLDS